MKFYLIASGTLLFAYLVGSINFAVIFSKIFMKEDVRSMGSGNAGTTNVMRNGGFAPGALTFVCDAAKGFIACFLGLKVFEYLDNVAEYGWAKGVYGAFICGLFCMIGHILPIFFQFKGGKGVATSVGIFAVCSPIAIVCGLIVFTLMVFICKMVSLSSIISTVVVVSMAVIFYDGEPSILPISFIVVLMGTIIIIKHKSNIKRIINGTESKVGKGGKK